jgi:hypothetical protein
VALPGTEPLARDEVRVIACGTGMPDQRLAQASACFLFEFGNGDKFIFDIGTGSMANTWFLKYAKNADVIIHESMMNPEQWVKFYAQPPQLAWRACGAGHGQPRDRAHLLRRGRRRCHLPTRHRLRP